MKRKTVSVKPRFILDQDRFGPSGHRKGPIIRSAADVEDVFNEMGSLDREIMVAGALDCHCRLVFCSLVGVGSAEQVLVRTADVFRGAIKSSAVSVFLVHNHPSGSLTPSAHDLKLTSEVAEAGLVLGYPLVDHVIISREGYRSLLELASLRGYCRDAQITPAVTQVAEEGPAVLLKWSCQRCSAANRASLSALRSDSCTPARCDNCLLFTWLWVLPGVAH